MRNRPGLGAARGILLAIGAVGTVLAVIVGAVLVGSSSIGPLDVFSIVLHKTLGTPLREGLPETSVAIVWTLRLPRVLVAFAAGAALSVGGCVVQSVLKNPLATPYTLGVSSGASLGAGLVIIFELSLPFAGGFTLPLMGFLCALGTVLLVLVFSSRVDRGMSNLTVILAGMVFSLFFSAVLTVITALARDDKLKQVTLWQMGSFSMRSWSHLGVLLPFLAAGLLMSLWMNKELDILTFGEESAASMGVNTVRAKQLLRGASDWCSRVRLRFHRLCGSGCPSYDAPVVRFPASGIDSHVRCRGRLPDGGRRPGRPHPPCAGRTPRRRSDRNHRRPLLRLRLLPPPSLRRCVVVGQGRERRTGEGIPIIFKGFFKDGKRGGSGLYRLPALCHAESMSVILPRSESFHRRRSFGAAAVPSPIRSFGTSGAWQGCRRQAVALIEGFRA